MFTNKLPFAEFDLFIASSDPSKPSSIDIKIKASKAKLSDDLANQPADPNCWRYIRQGSKEDNDLVKEVFIGPVVNVYQGVPLTINFENTLGTMDMGGMGGMSMGGDGPMLELPPINPPDMMPGMNPSVGVAVHLHGGKVESNVDGWPLQPMSFAGNPYRDDNGNPLQTSVSYTYRNNQRSAMLWFHDHGMDNTAPQVHAGLAGLYFIRDESDEDLFDLLRGTMLTAEIPLVIQDRVLAGNATRFDYKAGFALDAQGQAQRPEFLGNTILVNGREQPYQDVSQKRYRLRVLNGSNARTYALALINPDDLSGLDKTWFSHKITVIGNDGGLFATRKNLNPNDYLVLAPGERLDLILDLTDVCPTDVSKLRLVNLAVASLRKGGAVEAIFQHEANNGSIFRPATQAELISLLAINQANIMQFSLHHCTNHDHNHEHNCHCPVHALQTIISKKRFMAKLDRLLLEYANDEGQEGFEWNGTRLDSIPPNNIAANRLVLLMNDTSGFGKLTPPAPNPYTIEGQWHDTQIWEMGPVQAGGLTPFQIPFDAQLGGVVAGNPSALIGYQVKRSTFFAPATEADVITKANGMDFNHQYPPLEQASIVPTPGTYERWYVANLGNWQATDGPFTLQIPDMHPFHMHLVNFVALRRFTLEANGAFTETTSAQHIFDAEVRHDTVRINSNEMVELLVYFPPNYHGKYPYHCHLVEHEDMGMMLHFQV